MDGFRGSGHSSTCSALTPEYENRTRLCADLWEQVKGNTRRLQTVRISGSGRYRDPGRIRNHSHDLPFETKKPTPSVLKDMSIYYCARRLANQPDTGSPIGRAKMLVLARPSIPRTFCAPSLLMPATIVPTKPAFIAAIHIRFATTPACTNKLRCP
jgi:hypothetical protein